MLNLTQSIIKKILFTIIFLNSIFIYAQKKSNTILNGFWKSEGYGWILEINEKAVKIYNVCSTDCSPYSTIDRATFFNEYEIIKIAENNFTSKEGVTEYNFIRLEKLPQLCAELNKNKSNPIYNFKTLCTNFEEHYCYFDIRNINWRELKNRYKSKINNNTTTLELYILMEDMLKELGDNHSRMFVPNKLEAVYKKYKKQEEKKTKKGKKKRQRTSINTEVVRHAMVDKYVKNKNVYNYGAVIWGYINEDILLVQINGMNELANYNIPKNISEKEAYKLYQKNITESKNYTKDVINGAGYIMNRIVTAAKNSKVIILDIRLNGGGYDGAGMEMLRYFINKETEVLAKKAKTENGFTRPQIFKLTPAENIFSGKVYILTSPATASAAESFTLAAMESHSQCH